MKRELYAMKNRVMRLLITGGAGFVGSSLALRLKAHHRDWEVTAFDNLRRRGSELALPRLPAAGVRFVHGDVRRPDDLGEAGPADLLLECSAKPSVLAGLTSSPAYVLQTNLLGTLNCLEHVRRARGALLFLSTSRVYPTARLAALPLVETDSRFEINGTAALPAGVSMRGIAEDFSLKGARSLYGATKLASELFIQEYAASFGVPAFIDRCGLLTDPWQMGKVDQGIVMHWIASHVFGRPLTYLGWGGTGKQVRDILHVEDLGALIELQIDRMGKGRGEVLNVGGGRACSGSLRELTALASEATGTNVPVASNPENRVADVPLYLTDAGGVEKRFGRRPRRTPREIVEEIAVWIRGHRDALQAALG